MAEPSPAVSLPHPQPASTGAALLQRHQIAQLIPHAGRMCLLDRLLSRDPQTVVCAALNHRDPQHPLRTAGGLLSTCLIEYAAQAMALHGALIARDASGSAAGITPGYLASVRAVQLHRLRLDDLPAASPDELRIEVTRRAGDAQQVLYDFHVTHADTPLASGRAAVVLNTPLSSP